METPPLQPTVEADESSLGCLFAFGAVLLLLFLCFLVPLLVSVFIHPWFGLATAFGPFWVWARYGPQPFPGFLPGIVCIWGCAICLGALLGHARIVILHLAE